jgi:hypothetical protein
MLIKFWVDRMGNLYGDPKSDRQRASWSSASLARIGVRH